MGQATCSLSNVQAQQINLESVLRGATGSGSRQPMCSATTGGRICAGRQPPAGFVALLHLISLGSGGTNASHAHRSPDRAALRHGLHATTWPPGIIGTVDLRNAREAGDLAIARSLDEQRAWLCSALAACPRLADEQRSRSRCCAGHLAADGGGHTGCWPCACRPIQTNGRVVLTERPPPGAATRPIRRRRHEPGSQPSCRCAAAR